MRGKAIYTILGIEPDATQDEIKTAYRKTAKERHPDLNPDDPDADEKFRKAKKAYDILSDETTRKNWHERHSLLPWLWEKPAKPKEEMPPEGLNRVCIECLVVSHRCTLCHIGVCAHHGMMLKLSGHLPQPVCIDCKKQWEERNFSNWKLEQLVKSRFGRMGL